MTIDEMCSVMREFQRGSIVQVRPRSTHDDYEWVDTINPAWDWVCNEYRVKPQPREFWLLYPNPPCMFHSKEDAEAFRDKFNMLSGAKAIRVQEVLE